MDTGESHLLYENFLPNNETAPKIIFAVCDYRLRLILVGESTVGKTSLIRSSDTNTRPKVNLFENHRLVPTI